jgi:hypothetical protein
MRLETKSGLLLSAAVQTGMRASLQLQVVQDKRGAPEVRAVLVTGLASLDMVAHWHQGIQGDGIVARYRFAYDALVEEAKGMSG